MAPVSVKTLTGKQKAAILMITLGPEMSAKVFKRLTDEEIQLLTLEIANVRKVDFGEKTTVLNEFHEICMAQEFISQGGLHYAKSVLEKALGEEKAMSIISRLTSRLQVRPFDFARKVEPSQIFSFIQNEHPQTIALVLSYLDKQQAATILSSMPEEKQAEIAKRIALMDRTSPEVIRQIETILEQKLSSAFIQDYTQTGGIEAVVQILNSVDRSSERSILETLETQDPELAEEIKKRMFVFEDIVMLDNRSIQRIIRDADNHDLLLSLKGASEEVRNLIFKNISNRMAETFKEEMEYMGPVRLKDVEEAQSRIVGIIRRLEESGDIVVSRGGGDDIIV